MIKLIASDLDGTLLINGAQKLNPEVYDLILALKKHGVHFTAASGRQVASLRNLFGPVADEISYIAENGAICVHNNKLISTSEINHDLALRIIKYTKNLPNCKTLVSCVNTCYVEDGDKEFYDLIRYVYHNETSVIKDLCSITEPIIKVAVYDTRATQQTMQYCREIFDKEVNVVNAGNSWIDFVPFHSNKGTALKTLLNELQIDVADSMAFGDQQNDMEMLRTAGTSYAMATASPEVAACADYMTDSVEKILKKYLEQLA